MLLRWGLLVTQWLTYIFVSRNLAALWGYTGIDYARPSLLICLVLLIVLFAVAAIIPGEAIRPSQVAIWLLASFVVTPTFAIAAVNPTYPVTSRLIAAVSVTIGVVLVSLLTRDPGRPYLPGKQALTTRGLFITLVTVLTLLALLVLVVSHGLSGFDLSSEYEYARRLASRDISPPFPGANYLTSWLLSPLIPLLVAVAWVWKHWWMAALALVSAVGVYGFDGQKAPFVVAFVPVMVIYGVSRARRGSTLPWLGMLITFGIIVLPAVIGWIRPSSGIDYLITRRFGLVPGNLTVTYVEYAVEHGFTFFRQSYLRPFSQGYDTSALGVRVGEWLSPGGNLNANANLWADGYGSGGLLGVAAMTVLLALVLRWYDRLSLSRDPVISTAVLGTVCFAYVNGYFHNSLLTGGVLFAAALMWLMPDPRIELRQPTLSGSEPGILAVGRGSLEARPISRSGATDPRSDARQLAPTSRNLAGGLSIAQKRRQAPRQHRR